MGIVTVLWTINLRLEFHIHIHYHMQNIWSKSVIPALGSAESNLQRHIEGSHHELYFQSRSQRNIVQQQCTNNLGAFCPGSPIDQFPAHYQPGASHCIKISTIKPSQWPRRPVYWTQASTVKFARHPPPPMPISPFPPKISSIMIVPLYITHSTVFTWWHWTLNSRNTPKNESGISIKSGTLPLSESWWKPFNVPFKIHSWDEARW